MSNVQGSSGLAQIELTTDMVAAVLRELAQEKPEDDLDWQAKTGGRGIVATQITRRTFEAEMPWRVWVQRVAAFLTAQRTDPKSRLHRKASPCELCIIHALQGVVDSLVGDGGFDIDAQELSRTKILETIDALSTLGEGEEQFFIQMHVQLAFGVTYMKYAEAGSKDCSIIEAAQTIAREIAWDMYLRSGPSDADLFLEHLAKIARDQGSATPSKAKKASRRAA